MLRYEKVSNGEAVMTYRYYCEGKEENFGEIDFDISAGDVASVRAAKDDKFGFYWQHLASKLREMHSNNKFLNTGVIAWY